MGHAGGILRGAEDGDGGIRGEAEGFDAFEGLLPVVEAGSHAVDGEEWGLDELGRAPLTGLDRVMGLDMAIDLADAEAYVIPVYRQSALSCQFGRIWFVPIVSTGGGGKTIVMMQLCMRVSK